MMMMMITIILFSMINYCYCLFIFHFLLDEMDGWLARSACWPVELVVWRTTENTGLHRVSCFCRVDGSFSGGEVHGKHG